MTLKLSAATSSLVDDGFTLYSKIRSAIPSASPPTAEDVPADWTSESVPARPCLFLFCSSCCYLVGRRHRILFEAHRSGRCRRRRSPHCRSC